MDKNVSTASVPAKQQKTAAKGSPPVVPGGHATSLMWLSRIFGLVCFALVASVTVLSLSLIHLTKEAETNSLLAIAPTYSENLAYVEPLHVDMPTMDVLAEMFVRQYISTRNTVWTNAPEMRRMWGPKGVVSFMSMQSVYDAFWTREALRYYDGKEYPPIVMVEVDIKRILKEGWNSWQIFFDTRKMENSISNPVIDHWIATIQFRYYSGNARMLSRLRNPLGFTVTQYHIARQRR